MVNSNNRRSEIYDREFEIEAIRSLCEIVIKIHKKKSKTYGASWKKRGWVVSIFGNIARKFDRLEKIFTNTDLVQKFVENPNLNENEECIVDTLMDGAVYHLLAISEMMLTQPEIFDDWLKKNNLIDEEEKNG